MALDLINIVGSNIISFLAFSLIALFYMYLSFALFNGIEIKKILKKSSYKGISRMRLLGAVFTGFALSFTIIGLLFKLHFLPGGSFLVIAGVLGLFLSLTLATVQYRKSKSSFYRAVFNRIVIFGSIGLFSMMLPKDFWLEVKNRNYPNYIEAVKNAQAEPDNQALWDKVEKEREKMRGDK
jgi:hypothetical protein